jgi:hypothetical protein
MLFVGAASYAQPGPGPVVGANSSLVGQTGTSQNAQVKQIELSRVQRSNKRQNNDAFVYQGKYQGKLSVFSAVLTILQLKTRQI